MRLWVCYNLNQHLNLSHAGLKNLRNSRINKYDSKGTITSISWPESENIDTLEAVGGLGHFLGSDEKVYEWEQ